VLHRLARLAIAAPAWIVAAAVLFAVAAGWYGYSATQSLSAGGFQDPTAESSRAGRLVADKFGQGDLQLIFMVTAEGGVHSAAARSVATNIVDQLRTSPFVGEVSSTWTATPTGAAALTSRDGRSGIVIAAISGGGSEGQEHAKTLVQQLVVPHEGATVRVGGPAMAYVQINTQTKRDLVVMESIAIPLSFLVLVWVFGGLLAAALPVAVGLLAIVGTMAVLRVVALATEVSTFALNLTVALGLALALDYTLLIISRYREERADRADRDTALARTMATAGRTVLFSALTVAFSMGALALFPMYFLKSFAFAGTAVVTLTAVAALLVAPAAIVLLGDRIDALDVRRLGRRLLRRPDPPPRPVQQLFWYRLTKSVMRHVVLVGLPVIALLVVLGAPFLGVRWGFPDDRVLPGSASTRQVGDQLRDNFPSNPASAITAVIPRSGDVSAAELARYAAQLSRVADVSSVSAPTGSYVDGVRVGPPGAATAMADGSAFLTVFSTAPLFSASSETQLDRLHAVRGPSGERAQLTGTAQITHDSAAAINARLPLVLGVIATITFVQLFLLTRSVVLPLKALLLNVLSLTAAFGALVWVFQDGHLGGLGTTVTGTLVPNIPVLLFCIAFGLSMDYEVFLISRIHEYWLQSGQTRADNDESVALGLARVGRVVTAAALVMSISFAALIAGQVSIVRMFGLGLTLAVLMDATLVRMLLVPAFMHVLGRTNWWAPHPLAWLRRNVRIGKALPQTGGNVFAEGVPPRQTANSRPPHAQRYVSGTPAAVRRMREDSPPER
jgi:putative drug exporter of the RND superfamily